MIGRKLEMRKSHFIAALIIAASISILALFPQNRSPAPRCSLDGSRIEPLYEVTIVRADQISFSFSCVRSAQIWLMENGERISSIWVTDEMSGKKIRAGQAYYVESDIITTSHVGNRIHVFAEEEAAGLHLRQHKGKFVKNLLKAWQQKPLKLVKHTPHSQDCGGFPLPSTQKPLCLRSYATLMMRVDCSYISHKFLGRILAGYLSPPEKPPKGVA